MFSGGSKGNIGKKRDNDLGRSGCITEKEGKYLSSEYTEITNSGKLYLHPKIYKRLDYVPGRPVIFNCGTPTEKVSEFVDYHLKPVMQSGRSYIKDVGDFLKKIKNLDFLPENAVLVIADVVGLYSSIPHEADLQALEEALASRNRKQISTENDVEDVSVCTKE